MSRSSGAAKTPSNDRIKPKRVWPCAALLLLGAGAGCAGGSARSVVIDGTAVSVVRTERVKAIAEERANIKAGEGQEFVKVVLALKRGTRGSEELPKIVRAWKLVIRDASGRDQGPVFGWSFVDGNGSEVRVYSNPVPAGTKMDVLAVEGKPLSISGS